jgi:hypothetical protein
MAWGNTHGAWAKTETFLALQQLSTGPDPLVGCGNRTDEKRRAKQPEQHNQPLQTIVISDGKKSSQNGR